MSETLYYHPLSSFCQKALIALYEAEAPFERALVDLLDEDSAAAFRAVWPIGKFPVLQDAARGLTLPESTIIIEHLAARYPAAAGLLPAEPESAREVRLWDRVFDNYVNLPLQKIVTDRLRPPGRSDPIGVADARRLVETAFGVIEERMAGRSWAVGEAFTMADCAAAPALFYAEKIVPTGNCFPATARYAARLRERPSYARALKEAEPYFALIPQEPESA